MWWQLGSLSAWLPGGQSPLADVVVVDKLLDVSHLVVEVKEVGPGVLVHTVRLALFKLLVDSCPYILKHHSVKLQPPHRFVQNSPWILCCLSDVVWAGSRGGQTACCAGPAHCAACGTWRSSGWSPPCTSSSARRSRCSCKPCNEHIS